ncbi:MAG: hypothetical protein QOJ39_2479 [Candidatus Eremiobacteraeota bacterium]|jgi:hypothetical protein|nr:hypothetical protein [Candidatus Eremiobacteraeota bacterium]
MARVLSIAAVAILAASPLAAVPAPTPSPAPGGANQVGAVSGTVGQTLWNGVVRLQVTDARVATAADDLSVVLPSAAQKPLLITALVRNGTKASFTEVLSYTLADADDVAFEVPSYMVKPNPASIQQGAAARQRILFAVDKAYTPVKLLVQCQTCKKGTFRAFRLTLPAMAAPAPSASP